MDEGNQVFPQGGSAALVVIEFPSFRDFIDTYSPIISDEGIFIRNSDVSASNAFSVGDRVDFEVRLKDDFRLIQGAGEVVWLGPIEAADGASGTAIRFHDVDEPSRRLISRLVGNYVRDGGKLFEIGGPVADAEQEVEFELGSEEIVYLDELPADPQLTAETLKSAEANALFAGGGEDEHEAPLEFESAAPEEVGQSGSDAEAFEAVGDEAPDDAGVALGDAVGMETIAIPSGLVATLEAAEDEDSGSEAATDDHRSGEDGSGEPKSPFEDLEVAPAMSRPAMSREERFELPPILDNIPGAGAALAAAEDLAGDDLSGPTKALVANEIDESFLGATAVSPEADLAGREGIPGEIANVAGELTVVQRYEALEADEASSVNYAGSASARPERKTGGRIAALAVTFVLLGAAAYYFGDEFGGKILGLLGIGGDASDSAPTEMVRAGEAMPVQSPPTADDLGEVTTSDAPEGDEEVESASLGVTDADTASPGVADADASSGSVAAVQAVIETAEPEPVVTASPPAASDGVRRVERITWREEGGSTVVTIRLSSELSKADLEVVRVRQGAPREVIKIRGVEARYSPSEVTIGSRHVIRLRTGLHQTNGGSALHVVADLTGADVSILSAEPKGRDLEITFSRSA